jgi:hypothetical protein
MAPNTPTALRCIEFAPYIPLTCLLDAYGADKPFFLEMISEGAPFSWGTNDATLVSADRLRRHILGSFDEEDLEPLQPMLDDLKQIGDLLIDMED